MPTYIVTVTERYKVTGESLEQVLGSYHVRYEGVAMVTVGLGPDQVISQDDFEYLDGKVTAEEGNE